MKITCVVVSYNNGDLLREAIMSVVGQTRPVDEIIVADDASSDGSRQLIVALSHTYPNIKPILRERNLGVSANRDLAMREADGDFITYLDGDDQFLPPKIEAETKAVGQSLKTIAFSDIKLVKRGKAYVRTAEIADFAQLGASDRFRWVLRRIRPSPREMLIPRQAHLTIGGYNHNLRTYEDWDYTLRLAALPLKWVHSGTVGSIHHLRGVLSDQHPIKHLLDELRVLRLNQDLARRHAGLPLVLVVVARAIAFRSRWAVQFWYWGRTGQRPRRRPLNDSDAKFPG